jgi:hypothetical protein
MLILRIRIPRRITAPALVIAALAGIGGIAYAFDGPPGGPVSHSRPSEVVSRHTVPPLRGASLIALHVRVLHHAVVVGQGSRYRLHIIRSCELTHECGLPRQAARVWLHVVQSLPLGLTATFGRRTTRSLTAALTVRTSAATRPGTYRLRLRARLRLRRHGGNGNHLRRARITVTLTVTAAPGRAIAIAGSPTGPLMPGSVVPLDLLLTNTRDSRLVVTGLSVRIQGLSAPRADAAHPCTTADLAISQFSGSYGFALAPSRTRSLAELGVAPDQWPALSMLARPVNQDGCQGATISLAYGATMTGASK